MAMVSSDTRRSHHPRQPAGGCRPLQQETPPARHDFGGGLPGGLHGGNRVAAGWSLGIDPSEFVDFSADLNPFGPPPRLLERIASMEAALSWYPEPTYRRLREAIGRRFGIGAGSILPGNGCSDLIHLVTRWQAARQAASRKKAGVVVPTFTEYERALRADNLSILPWSLKEEENFAPDRLDAQGVALDEVQALFLCHPNNPTGRLWPRRELSELLRRCEACQVLLVVDESYLDLVENSQEHSFIQEVERSRHLVVLRSWTKAFAVPGLRIGFLAAHPELVASLQAIQPPWQVSGIAAEVGVALCGEGSYLQQTALRLRALREALQEGLERLGGISPLPSEANFLLCRLEEGVGPGGELAEALAHRRILIRVCDDFTGLPPNRYIRLAVRRQEENQRLLQALGEILGRAG